MVFMLSYSDLPNGSKPSGARVFEYKHVQTFLKTLRRSYKIHYGKTSEISYVLAGEQGSKTGRVHWHVIIFSKQPITVLGSFSNLYSAEFLDAPRITKKGINQNWSLWPHGFVCPQIPDEGGMSYVLKYALKDQFNSVKSKGTNRFTKSENYSSAMFRMSKKPPIGFRFLETYCDNLAQIGSVLPSLEIKIPDTSGYWHPMGNFREYLCQRLWQINEQHILDTSQPCPQWSTLIHSVVTKLNSNPTDKYEINKDFEMLTYGELTDGQIYDETADERQTANLKRYFAGREQSKSSAEITAKCGAVQPCIDCVAFLTDRELLTLEKSENKYFRLWQAKGYGKTKFEFRAWWKTKFRPSKGCQLRELDALKDAFKGRRAIYRLSQNIGGHSSKER